MLFGEHTSSFTELRQKCGLDLGGMSNWWGLEMNPLVPLVPQMSDIEFLEPASRSDQIDALLKFALSMQLELITVFGYIRQILESDFCMAYIVLKEEHFAQNTVAIPQIQLRRLDSAECLQTDHESTPTGDLATKLRQSLRSLCIEETTDLYQSKHSRERSTQWPSGILLDSRKPLKPWHVTLRYLHSEVS